MPRLRLSLLRILGLPLVLASALPAASPPLVPGNARKSDDPAEASWRGLALPDLASLPRLSALPAANPRLYFSASDLPALRARAGLGGPRPAADPRGFLADRWAKIRKDADAALAKTFTDEDSRAIAAKTLAFAWQLAADTRYRDRAAALLADAFAEKSDDDLSIAHQLANYATAYDWLAADLVPAARDAASARLATGARLAVDYLNGGARAHNHRSKAAAALLTWALAVGPEKIAGLDPQAAFDLAYDRGLRPVWNYMFTPDGVYRDGAGYYWLYTAILSTPALHQLKHALGADLFPALRPAFAWQFKTATPRGWTPNLEDGSYKTTWLVSVAAAYRDTPAPEFGNAATLGQLFQWRFFHADNTPVRYPMNRNDEDSWNGAPGGVYLWPDEFILYAPDLADLAPDDARASFDFAGGGAGGPSVLRTDWRLRDRATRWVYFEGTPMSYNHDHADALQVLFEAEDSPLLTDNGYGPKKFSKRAGWAPAFNHNVVTKLSGPDEIALGDPSPSRRVLLAPFFQLVEKDAGWVDAATTDRQTRTVMLAGGDYLAVLDHLTAPAERTWRTRWHGRGALAPDGPGWKWTTPAASPWGAPAELSAFFVPSAKLALGNEQTFNPYQAQLEPRPALAFDRTGNDALQLALFSPSAPGAKDDAAFTALPLEKSGAGLAAGFTRGASRDRWLAASVTGPLAQGDLAAQARLVWWRQAADTGAVRQFALLDGTELRVSGALACAASQPVTLAADLATNGRATLWLAASSAPEPLTLRLARPGATGVEATLNGRPVGASIESGLARITLPAGAAGVLVLTTRR